VIIEPGGARCACGNRGCFETVAAGPATTSTQSMTPAAATIEGVERELPHARIPWSSPRFRIFTPFAVEIAAVWESSATASPVPASSSLSQRNP